MDADMEAEAAALARAIANVERKKDDASALTDETGLVAPSEETAANNRAAGASGLVRLNLVNGSHQPNGETARLVREIGGRTALERFTNKFYERAFADAHIDTFIRNHNDPHGQRFAAWIAEKLGAGTPWTDERATRPQCPVTGLAGDAKPTIVHDRTTAHYAAWHSPKRQPEHVGKRFKVDDCRVWMRLHFWAARETGLLDHAGFADYYVRFIGHFVEVYERRAPPFARESARWSADPANLERYLQNGCKMDDVLGVSFDAALDELPPHERAYAGNNMGQVPWPYGEPSTHSVSGAPVASRPEAG